MASESKPPEDERGASVTDLWEWHDSRNPLEVILKKASDSKYVKFLVSSALDPSQLGRELERLEELLGSNDPNSEQYQRYSRFLKGDSLLTQDEIGADDEILPKISKMVDKFSDQDRESERIRNLLIALYDMRNMVYVRRDLQISDDEERWRDLVDRLSSALL